MASTTQASPKAKISLVILASIALLGSAPTFAATAKATSSVAKPVSEPASSIGRGITDRLSRAEKCILGDSHRERGLVDRFSALEEQLFGQPSTGPAVTRMQAIEDVLGGKTTTASARKNTPQKVVQSNHLPQAKLARAKPEKPLPPIKVSHSDFLPPIAPQLDLSATASGLNSTGASSSGGSTHDTNSAPASAAATFPSGTANSQLDALSPSPAPEPFATQRTADSTTGTTNNTVAGNKNPDSDPQVKELLRNGLAAHNEGNDTKAEKLFKEALVKSPFNSTAFYNLGAIAEQKGDLVGALGSYRTALIARPDDPQLQAAVAQVEDAIVRKQGGPFGNPIVYNDGKQTILRGNASDFGVNGYTNGGAFNGTAMAANQAPFQNPYAAQITQQGSQPPVLNVGQQLPPRRGRFSGRLGSAAAELATTLAISGTRAALGGGGLGPGTFVNALHCPVCRLLH